MWFAWKLVLLQYRKQLSVSTFWYLNSCDLLENSYFCSIANNNPSAELVGVLLWFAWKLVLLQYRKQLVCLFISKALSCDLLENSYFCSIANNVKPKLYLRKGVVICLKTRTFAVSQTTTCPIYFCGFLLWFAWKLVLLQYRKQLALKIVSCALSCDLLENSYFCSIANNLLASV